MRQAFEKYLEFGIFAHEFARARCGDCGHDFLAAYMAALHIGAVAFIHRFGSILNEHVHIHVCAVDGVFEEVAGEGDDGADAVSQISPPRICFDPRTCVYADAVTQVQTTLRKRILRAFVGRGLLEGLEAKEMLAYRHSGFSIDTSVCIAAHDRAGLRACRLYARPPFALDRLRKAGSELIYRCAKQLSEPGSDQRNAKRGVRADGQHLEVDPEFGTGVYS